MPAARILIVEDEGLTAMELQRKLKFLGYDVPTFAFSGKEAIIKAEELKPDLILMDIVLKGKIDGIEATKEITKNQDIPVIYLTAHGDEKTKKRAKSTGPYAYILKPFDESELQKHIDQALYQYQMDKILEKNAQVNEQGFEKAGAAVLITDNEGIIHFVNYSASYLMGMDKKDILEKNINEVFTFKKRGLNETELDNPVFEILNKNSNEIEGNDWLKTSSGSEIPIKYTVAPIKTDDGKLNGATLIFKDLSYLGEVDFNKKFIEKICTQSKIETAVFDLEGYLVHANDSFLEFFSAESVSELEKMNLFNDFGVTDELKTQINDSEVLNHQIKFKQSSPYLMSNKSIKTNINLNLSIKMISAVDKDNNSDFEGYLVYINEFDNLIGTNINLEDLKELNADFEVIFNSIDDIFFVMDPYFKCIQWNAAAENLTGINSRDAVGKSLYDLFPDLKNSETEKLYLKAFESQKHQKLIKDDIKSDSTGFIEISAYPSKKRVSVIIRDVTLAKKSEKDLKYKKNFFKSIIETQTDPVCVFYRDGSIYFCNNSFKNIISSKSNFLEIMPEEINLKLKKYLDNLSARNSGNDFIFKTSLGDKVLKWDMKAPTKDEHGNQLFLAIGKILNLDKTDSNKFKAENSALKQDNQSLTKLKEKLQRDLESMEARLHDLRQKEEKLVSEKQELKSNSDKQLKSLENDKNELKLQIAQLKKSELGLNEKIKYLKDEFQTKLKNLEINKDKMHSERNEVLESEKNLKESLLKVERQYNSLLEENKILRNDKSKLKQHTRKVQNEYMELENEFKGRLDSYKAQISQLKQINKSLTKEYEFLEKRLSKSREEVETQVKILENEKNFLEKSNNQLQKELDDSKTEINDFKREIKSFKTEISELKSNKTSVTEKYNGMIHDYNKKLSDLELHNQTLKSDLNLLKNKEESLKQKELLLKNEVKELKTSTSNLKSQISSLKKTESQMNLKYDELQKSSKTSLKDLKSTNKKLKEDLKSLKELKGALITENKVMVQNFRQKISDLEKERTKTISEAELLKKARDDLKNSLEDRNNAIRDMKNQFKRNMQTMNSILGINSTYMMEKFLEKTRDTQMQVEIASLAQSNILQFSELGKINLNSYLSSLIEEIGRYHSLEDNKINFKAEFNKLLLKSEIASNMGLLISELISFIVLNTKKTPGLPINILLTSEQEIINLEIKTDLKLPKNHEGHDLPLQIAETISRELGSKLDVNLNTKTLFKAQFTLIDNNLNAKN